MSTKVKIFIILLTAGFVLPSPINQDEEQRIDIPEGSKAKDVGNYITNPKENCAKEDEASDCSNSSEERSAVSRSTFQQEEQPAADYWQPLSSLPHYHQAYEGYPSLQTMGIEDGTYIDMLYPYLYPRLRATYNTGFNVNSLPPVHSTYIHGLVPQEEMQQIRYDLDILQPRRELFYRQPAVVRPVRTLRNPEDDFMAQLRHDAIMNNIVPTMQVPFARFASLAPAPAPAPLPRPLPPPIPAAAPLPYAPYAPAPYAPAIPSPGAPTLIPGPAGLTALFPSSGSGCAQPILFSCTPKITRGLLRPSYAPAAAVPVHEASGYREVPKHSQNVERHNTPTKVGLVDKSTEIKHEQ